MDITRERALAVAKAAEAQLNGGLNLGLLHGIPYAVKDLYDVRGLATTAGTHLLEDNIATNDCTAVARLDAAGMVLLGKTHTVQFALGIIGINSDQGTPHNPWHETPHVPAVPAAARRCLFRPGWRRWRLAPTPADRCARLPRCAGWWV